MTGTVSSRRRAAIACAIACAILLGERAAIAQKKFLIFGDSKVSYTTFRDMAGRFELEYPTKDWGSFPPGGSTIAILSRNDKTATVVIDHSRLTEPLAPQEITTNAKIEIDNLKEQQPNAKGFTSELLDCKAGSGSLIRYSRAGARGPERVMRYSVGVDKDLYRLDAVVAEASLARFEPILMHMIQSFKAPAGPVTSKN